MRRLAQGRTAAPTLQPPIAQATRPYREAPQQGRAVSLGLLLVFRFLCRGRIGTDATVGHVIGSGEVVLEDRATVQGNVYSTTPTVCNSVALGGKLAPFTDVPWATITLLQISWPTTRQPEINQEPGQPAAPLYAGTVYAKLRVAPQATYSITQPGDYFFQRLVVESGGKLLINVGSGTVRLFVEKEVILNGEVEEVLDPSESPATTRVLAVRRRSVHRAWSDGAASAQSSAHLGAERRCSRDRSGGVGSTHAGAGPGRSSRARRQSRHRRGPGLGFVGIAIGGQAVHEATLG
jgi:hypothetical protein